MATAKKEPKTLKDVKKPGKTVAEEIDLRSEAIKHIKARQLYIRQNAISDDDLDVFIIPENDKLALAYAAQIKWIKHFFNLTDEEINNG